ncbi:MAG: hypothetical protein QG644_435 [Patescibacteria group bacterium]|nr:hypothetical protein [Candidatus Paceibacterota bacterium]MDQ5922727.1 hypothetical protein [Patescibacteria group bacterium]
MKKLILILVLLVVVLGATTFYFYKNSKLYKVDQNVADQAEAKALMEKVGKLIVLPEGEVPTIATVTDPEALKDQAFFSDAKQGDKVLIFNNAKKAILYNPTLNKIVTIAPINIGEQKSSDPATPVKEAEKKN